MCPADARSGLSHTHLREILHYDPETGVFTWRVARGRGIEPGDIAGTLSYGYREIRIAPHKNRFRAARLAWFYMTGEWPPEVVDHINLNRADDAWANLRLATHSQNHANTRHRRDNIAALKGVYRIADSLWRAQITIKRKTRNLGHFSTPEAASAAYSAAAMAEYGAFSRS